MKELVDLKSWYSNDMSIEILEHSKTNRPNVFWYQLEKGEVAKMAETEQRVQLDSIEHAKAHQFPLTKFTGLKLQTSSGFIDKDSVTSYNS